MLASSRLRIACCRFDTSAFRNTQRQLSQLNGGRYSQLHTTNACGLTKRTLLKKVLQKKRQHLLPQVSYSTVLNSQANEDANQTVEADYKTVITDKEKSSGPSEKREFQAETRMLLDIVAKSLYSEKEVFIRELVSNASDALEKLRYLQMTNAEGVPKEAKFEIHIATDKLERTFTVQDTGIGMTKEELIDHLGTIAKSGSKNFLNELKEKGKLSAENIIGQFGVGFYSAFMVADKVDVYTRSYKDGSKGWKWSSDGSGTYEIAEAENVQQGTKIVVHLKTGEITDFGDEKKIEDVIRKYSNFVSCPIFVNGKQANTIQALWTMDAKEVTAEMHDEFYRFIAHNQYDRPRYALHYKADAPVNIRALIYVPEHKPSFFELSHESDPGVALYSHRVMIQPKAKNILPKWMRFLKGVIDSEDIPLNLSRELLQQTAVINKLKTVVTNRILRFFQEQMKRDREKYEAFHADYNIFMKEAIIQTGDQQEKEDIAKLLLFESSNHREGVKVSLQEYASRMQAGTRDIYYLCAPRNNWGHCLEMFQKNTKVFGVGLNKSGDTLPQSRHLAETSPYYEAIRAKNHEVLFCFDNYDDLTLLQLAQFDRKTLTSVEKAIRSDKGEAEAKADDKAPISADDVKALSSWIKETLGERKVKEVKTTARLSSYPCFITVEEMSAARHFVKTQFAHLPEDQRFLLLQPTLEINSSHPIMVKLNELRSSKPDVAKLVLEQIYDNSMVAAGLLDDSRSMIGRLNTLIETLLVGEVPKKGGSSQSEAASAESRDQEKPAETMSP